MVCTFLLPIMRIHTLIMGKIKVRTLILSLSYVWESLHCRLFSPKVHWGSRKLGFASFLPLYGTAAHHPFNSSFSFGICMLGDCKNKLSVVCPWWINLKMKHYIYRLLFTWNINARHRRRLRTRGVEGEGVPPNIKKNAGHWI